MLIIKGQDLSLLRNFEGLNQAEFGEKFGIGDRNSIAKLEKSKVVPAKIFKKVQDSLGMSDEDIELLLTQLESNGQNNNDKQNERYLMEKSVNDFLHQEFKTSTASKELEIKRLSEERNKLQSELTQAQSNYLELSRRIDLQKHEFEIYKLKMEQVISDALNKANQYTDESLTDIEESIIENAKQEVTRILSEHLQQNESKGLSGTGEFLVSNLLENAPNIIEAIMKMKSGFYDQQGMNDNFNTTGPSNHNFQKKHDRYPDHEFYNPNFNEQNQGSSNTVPNQEIDNNEAINNNLNINGVNDETKS